MRKKRSQLNFAQDIVEQIENIAIKLEKVFYEEFRENEDLQLIVERRLMIIGEAIANIEIENLLKVKDDRTYWRVIKDMRNVLVHEYWGMDTQTIYEVGKENLSELEEYIKIVIQNLEENSLEG